MLTKLKCSMVKYLFNFQECLSIAKLLMNYLIHRIIIEKGWFKNL